MSINRKRTAMMVISSVAAGVLLPTTASHAAEAPAARPEGSSTISGRGRGEVITKVVELTAKLHHIVDSAIGSGYVKSLTEGSFHETGQRYNVVVANDANRYAGDLHDVVYDAGAAATAAPTG